MPLGIRGGSSFRFRWVSGSFDRSFVRSFVRIAKLILRKAFFSSGPGIKRYSKTRRRNGDDDSEGGEGRDVLEGRCHLLVTPVCPFAFLQNHDHPNEETEGLRRFLLMNHHTSEGKCLEGSKPLALLRES